MRIITGLYRGRHRTPKVAPTPFPPRTGDCARIRFLSMLTGRVGGLGLAVADLFASWAIKAPLAGCGDVHVQ